MTTALSVALVLSIAMDAFIVAAIVSRNARGNDKRNEYRYGEFQCNGCAYGRGYFLPRG